MKQRSVVLANIVLIALLCAVFTNYCDARTNDSFWDTKRHESASIEEAGFNFLRAYRTLLTSGLPGLTEATATTISQECQTDLANLTNNNELLMQCKSIYMLFYYKLYILSIFSDASFIFFYLLTW